MELTREEKKALDQKLANVDLTVLCPRCGKELVYKDYGHAETIQCQTPDCIRYTLRGL